MKKVLLILMGLTLILFTACGKKQETAKVKKVDYKVGVVLGIGGRGDKSFNDSAYDGLVKAGKDLGVETKYIEPQSLADYDQFLTQFAENNYDLIIAVGFDSQKSVEKVAKQYPNKKFAIIDSIVDLPNVKSIIFDQKEGSFLAGAVAEMVSKTSTLGFIGAIDIPMINTFRDGFVQGAQYVNPNSDVKKLYIGGNSPFNDPAKAKELALSLKENKADVIYTVAGGSGRGTLEAIKANDDLFGIGVDANQDGEAKGKILTSILKRVDTAVYNTAKEGLDGTFKGGLVTLGLKENGMGTTNFEFTKDVIGADNLAKLEQIKKDLISGKIKLK